MKKPVPEVKTIRRSPWNTIKVSEREWFIAFEQIDQYGKTDRLVNLLRSEKDLSLKMRWHLADLLERHVLGHRRGQQASSTYNKSAVEQDVASVLARANLLSDKLPTNDAIYRAAKEALEDGTHSEWTLEKLTDAAISLHEGKRRPTREQKRRATPAMSDQEADTKAILAKAKELLAESNENDVKLSMRHAISLAAFQAETYGSDLIALDDAAAAVFYRPR